MAMRTPLRADRSTRSTDGAAPTYDSKEAKRGRRDEALARRARLERSETRRRRLIWVGAVVASIAALGALGWWLFGPTNEPKVQSIPNQGQTHIQRNTQHPPYNSVPPTSGWHYGDAVAPPGISRDPILNEIQVHNLEHGEVMVQYDCPEGCPEVIAKLEAIVRSYPKKVVLAPYPGLFDEAKQRIALTAWTKLVYLNDVDEAYIRKFIRNNKDKAPEFFPD